jgi:hypothetical protein
MSTALDQPLVAGYLRELDVALAALPPAVATELSQDLRAHLLQTLPGGADDDTARNALVALGPATLAALAGAWPGSDQSAKHDRKPLLRRALAGAKRVPGRFWVLLAAAAIAVAVPTGTLIYWHTQPDITVAGSFALWTPEDHVVQTQADGATQITIPLRPGHIQGFAVTVYNPSDLSQRILGAAANTISPGAPEPPRIAVSTSLPMKLFGEPHAVHYQAVGTIPPHSYRWLRVLWRSYQCYLEGPGGSQGIDALTLQVKIGWITRTEVVPIGTEVAVSPLTKWPAWCNGQQPQP